MLSFHFRLRMPTLLKVTPRTGSCRPFHPTSEMPSIFRLQPTTWLSPMFSICKALSAFRAWSTYVFPIPALRCTSTKNLPDLPQDHFSGSRFQADNSFLLCLVTQYGDAMCSLYGLQAIQEQWPASYSSSYPEDLDVHLTTSELGV